MNKNCLQKIFVLSETPLVSVIIAVHNGASFVKDAIESVLGQSYLNLEIVVIDDGSTDGTWEILASFGTKIRAVKQENTGVSGARNHGILLSRGEIINFLDADDIMLPDRVESQLLFLRRHPEVAAVFSDYVNFRGDEITASTHFQRCPRLRKILEGYGKGELLLDPKESRKLLVKDNFTSANTCLFHREALKFAGLLDTELSQGEDFEFFYRIARKYPVGICNRVDVRRRLHQGNATSRRYALVTRAGRQREKILGYETEPALRAALKVWLCNLYLELGGSTAKEQPLQALRLTMHSMKFCHPFRRKVFRNLIRSLAFRFTPSGGDRVEQRSGKSSATPDPLED